ncbi:DUF2975 domain-containing protein [Serinicoccus sp. LYQ131]|uniref:DUF2975 domain-containing protein n=1 Tax=Serinicoccus sp. LYQ131 TaxID=3378797 RepID=UPI0038518D36
MSSPSRPRIGMTFGRSDRIVTSVLLWALVGVSAAYALFISVDWALRRQVTLTGVLVDVPDDAAGTGRVVSTPEVHLLVQDVSAAHFALLLLPTLLMLAAIVWGAVLLARLLGDLGRGEPFGRSNTARLRIVAVLLIVVPLVVSLLEGIARAEILAARDAPQFMFTFTPAWVVAGLLVAALAQAFATGTRLTADVDGLV